MKCLLRQSVVKTHLSEEEKTISWNLPETRAYEVPFGEEKLVNSSPATQLLLRPGHVGGRGRAIANSGQMSDGEPPLALNHGSVWQYCQPLPPIVPRKTQRLGDGRFSSRGRTLRRG